MYPKTVVIGIIILICCLQACTTLRNGGAPEISFDINSDLEKLATIFESSTNISNYYATEPSERVNARNRFISGRLVQIDLRYLQFIQILTSDKQQLDSATDIVNMSLNLAGTIIGGVESKVHLAAAAAGIGGIKTTIDKDFYYEKSIDALIATMNAKRKEVLVIILNGMTTKEIDQYPFERALTDIQQYYLAGTLNRAIQSITAESAKSEAQSNSKINVLYKLAIPTEIQIENIEKLTDSIGSDELTLEMAKKILLNLGIKNEDIPSNLEGARKILKEKIRKAKNMPDAERNSAIEKLMKEFKNAGVL